MNVASGPRIVRHGARFREITSVLAEYGLVGWLAGAQAEWAQQLIRGLEGKRTDEHSLEVRVRLALGKLGTTFIKLGQILSTRPDLVGPELADELTKLQSGTPADARETIRGTIMAELAATPEELFLEFDDTALASASIAQIHRARTRDGRRVVVKIQHQGIEERIRNDLEILIELARLAEEFSEPLRQFQPLATAQEFSRTLLRELDFGREAKNLRQFAQNFRTDDGVQFPAPYSELSAHRVLTMDQLEGISLGDADALRAGEHDLADVARRGASMFVEMIFRDGFYHADPHPGNLMVLAGDVIGVLDCGMVGRVDDDLREQIEDMLLAAVDQDPGRLTESVVRLGRVPANFDRESLHSEIDEFVQEYRDQSLDEFDLSGALNGIIDIVRGHRIVLPSRIALLLKVLVMLEGTSRQLNPDFSLAELLGPYRDKAIQRRLSPERMWRKLQTAHRDWSRLLEILPGGLTDILERVKSGSFDVHLEHRRLEATVNRLVLGILAAALFMGSAVLWSRAVPPVVAGYSVPGALGCAAAVVIGWRVLRAIKRSGNLSD